MTPLTTVINKSLFALDLKAAFVLRIVSAVVKASGRSSKPAVAQSLLRPILLRDRVL